MLSRKLLAAPILVALGTLAGANAVLASPAAVAAQSRPAVPTQGFLVENEAHGLCLDAQSRHDGRNGDPVQLWKCQTDPFTVGNQLWNLVEKTYGLEIVNGAHNLCLQAQPRHDGSRGDPVQLWRCQARPGPHSSQLWQVSQPPFPDITNNAHGLCLEALRQHDGSNGDKVQLGGRCINTRNQRWNWVAQQ
jgi:hypothetical protein